jgi:mRNA interferase MazF
VRRGDIYLCDFGDPIGHEQGFQRPALIISHDDMTRYGLPVVLPVTRTKRGYPTHVEIDGVLPVTSYIQCEQIRTVSTERMIRLLGNISDLTLIRVEQILRRILVL